MVLLSQQLYIEVDNGNFLRHFGLRSFVLTCKNMAVMVSDK